MQEQHSPVRHQVKEPDTATQLFNTFKFSKELKRRMRSPEKIPELVKTYKHHIREARKIERLLRKMGYKVNTQLDTSSSGSDEELAERGQ